MVASILQQERLAPVLAVAFRLIPPRMAIQEILIECLSLFSVVAAGGKAIPSRR
jgi:hypothetical protein